MWAAQPCDFILFKMPAAMKESSSLNPSRVRMAICMTGSGRGDEEEDGTFAKLQSRLKTGHLNVRNGSIFGSGLKPPVESDPALTASETPGS